MKVAKFGGSSLADSEQFGKAVRIIREDPERSVIVVSAPGKRLKGDEKITDLLYAWHAAARSNQPYQEYMQKVQDRFEEIVVNLRLDLRLDLEFQNMEYIIAQHEMGTAAYAASRGEYLSARIMALALGYEFVHAEDCIFFDERRCLLNRDENIRKRIGDKKVVIPGFFGAVEFDSTQIVTFARGGSDLTGAIVARAMKASVYENWTDVSGLYVCDPRIVSNPMGVKRVTYGAMRESAYMGANVFQEEAMFPVQEGNIPTNIRNTNEPDHPGTMIYSEIKYAADVKLSGISGHKGYTVITIERMMMNREIGFARKILSVLEDLEISFEHMPGGIDTLSLIISKEALGDKLTELTDAIKKAVEVDRIKVNTHMSMIGIVGGATIQQPGTKAIVFQALSVANINAKMINLGSGNSLFIGVGDAYYEATIRVLYNALAWQFC